MKIVLKVFINQYSKKGEDMFCKYCGQKNQENSKFCQNCGGKVEEQNNTNVTTNNIQNSVPTINAPQKNDNKLILIIAVIIGICAIALPIIMMNGDKIEEKDYKDQDENKVDNSVEPEINHPVNTDKVQYGGYSFDIPYEYNKMEYEGNLLVYPNDSTWMIMFMFSDSNFYQLKEQTELIDVMLGAQYDNVSSVLKTHQGVEYILTDVMADGEEMQIIITDVGNNKVLMSLIMPMSNDVTFDELFNLAFPIIITVE